MSRPILRANSSQRMAAMRPEPNMLERKFGRGIVERTATQQAFQDQYGVAVEEKAK